MLQTRRSLDFSVYLILPVALWPGVYSASKEMSTRNIPARGKEWLVCKAENLIAICELIRKCGILLWWPA
jgi:hypothetical protein